MPSTPERERSTLQLAYRMADEEQRNVIAVIKERPGLEYTLWGHYCVWADEADAWERANGILVTWRLPVVGMVKSQDVARIRDRLDLLLGLKNGANHPPSG